MSVENYPVWPEALHSGGAARLAVPWWTHGLPPIEKRCAGGDVSALTAASEAAPAKPWTGPRPPSSSPRRPVAAGDAGAASTR